MHRLNNERIEAVLAALYDFALDDGTTKTMLQEFAGLFDCHFVDAFSRSNDYTHWRGVQHGLGDDDYHDVFLGTWVKSNVWGKVRPTRRAGDVVTTREITGVAELKRSDMFVEYLDPRDLHEGLRLDIWASDLGIEDMSLLRPWSSGPFSPRELEIAHYLMPHLRRVSAVRRQLRQSSLSAATSLVALETLRTGILLLDRQGRVLHANGVAEALLRAGDGLSFGPGGLAASTAAQSRTLQSILLAAIGRPGQAARSGSMRVSRRSGLPALSLIVTPARSSDTEPLGFAGPAVLACIADPSTTVTVPTRYLTALFKLSPAEAALAGSLLLGHEIRDIAEQSGRSVNTVRSLLRRLLLKTDTHRQSDLMRLLTMLPVR